MNEPEAFSAAADRLIHRRQITCESFSRDDGLVELHAVIMDTKPFAIDLPDRSLEPNEPIHEMQVKLLVDQDCTIRAVDAKTVASPYVVCGAIAPSYSRLIGLVISPGFTREVKALFAGKAGCTHMTELLPIMATVLFQTLWSEDNDRARRGENWTSGKQLSAVGGCHVLQPGGDAAERAFTDKRGKLRTSHPK